MSMRMRPTSVQSGSGSGMKEQIPNSHFKTYSFVHEDKDGSLFDEDDDIKVRYLEKELALKRINDELEKKTSEIFKKIEKFRCHENLSTPTFYNEEIGQGDGPQNAYKSNYDFASEEEERHEPQNPFVPPMKNYDGKRVSQTRPNSSYYNLSRGTSTSSNNDQFSQFTPWDSKKFNDETCFYTSKRPATANPTMVSFPDNSSVLSHTESSIRRIEPPKSLEGIEEKHQARLQKATESVLKCVQSKLVNYEQRLADMHLQYRQKMQENTMLEGKVKAMEEDRRRLLKTVQTLQSTTDKFSKSAESSKMNLNLKAQAFASLKKEMDGLKRDLKQKNCMIQSLQTRLDRCTEENRRLKSQHHATQLNMKQQHNEDRTSMDELKQRIIALENQKASFQTTIEKQAQLIKNLRNNRVSQNNSSIEDEHEQT